MSYVKLYKEYFSDVLTKIKCYEAQNISEMSYVKLYKEYFSDVLTKIKCYEA